MNYYVFARIATCLLLQFKTFHDNKKLFFCENYVEHFHNPAICDMQLHTSKLDVTGTLLLMSLLTDIIVIIPVKTTSLRTA